MQVCEGVHRKKGNMVPSSFHWKTLSLYISKIPQTTIHIYTFRKTFTFTQKPMDASPGIGAVFRSPSLLLIRTFISYLNAPSKFLQKFFELECVCLNRCLALLHKGFTYATEEEWLQLTTSFMHLPKVKPKWRREGDVGVKLMGI